MGDIEKRFKELTENQPTKNLDELLEYTWDETIEESFYDEYFFEGPDNDKVYNVGDIVFVPQIETATGIISGHRILVISRVDKDTYKGFIMSSKVDKANKYNKHFPNNLFVNNYNDILIKGPLKNCSIIVAVDNLVSFNRNELSEKGSFKGHVKDNFLQFVLNGYNNYLNGISNKNMFWE